MEAKRKVLLIDNSKMIHALVRAHLDEEAVAVHSAYDGAEGMKLAAAVRPDLVLLDVEMPAPDGWEVCRLLKADAELKDAPIIFLTAETDTRQKIRGLELGATDYVTKPCDPAELVARVRSALRTKELTDLLAEQAMIDGLTGLRNRRYFDQRLGAELASAKRYGDTLGCVVADIDHFKQFNDRYGHAVGDGVLRLVGRVFKEAARAEDVVCRYGGEEFVFLLPRTPLAAAAVFAERARAALQAAGTNRKDARLSVTASFGVADSTCAADAGVVAAADLALYAAKRAGRNRVQAATITAVPAGV